MDAGASGDPEDEITVDTTPPIGSFDPPSPSAFMVTKETVSLSLKYTGADTIDVRTEDISASEDSTSVCEFEVKNGTSSSPTILAKNCTDGTLKVKVEANRAWDHAGNYADAVESEEIEFKPAPTASIQTPNTCLVGAVLPNSISVTFSVEVTDVGLEDFKFSGEGCAAQVTDVNLEEGNVATISVCGDREAQVACTFSVLRDGITDLKGRKLKEDVSYTYDLSPHYYYLLPGENSYEDLRFGPNCTGWSKIITDQHMDIKGMGFQSDGKIVAAGIYNSGQEIAILRMSAGGLLDEGFGNAGVKTHTIADENNLKITDMIVQPDDNIVLVGYSETSGQDLIVKLTPDADLDESFSDDGIILDRISGGDSSKITGVSIDDDGNILIAGTREIDGSPAFYVARILENGSFDPSFNENGPNPGVLVISDAPGVSGSLALDAEGRIVVVGTENPNTSNSRQIVVRILPNGSIDPSFANGGFYNKNVDKGFFHRILIDNDLQRIYIGGHEDNPDDDDIHNRIHSSVHALTEAGNPDLTFGNNGAVRGMWGLHNTTNSIQDLKLDHNGRIAVAISIQVDAGSHKWNLAATQINPDGSFNTETWGTIRHWRPELNTNEFTTRLLVDEHNRYILGGYQNNGGSYPIFLRITGLPVDE